MSLGPDHPTITELRPYRLPSPFATCRFLCGSWWTAWSDPEQRHTWRICSDSVLATGEPLSVLIPSLREPLDPVVTPETGWQGPVPEWQGIPCHLGRVEMWLPDRDPFLLRPFSLLVLLPERDPPVWLPYVLLGMQFLAEYHVALRLNCEHFPGAGQLEIP